MVSKSRQLLSKSSLFFASLGSGEEERSLTNEETFATLEGLGNAFFVFLECFLTEVRLILLRISVNRLMW